MKVAIYSRGLEDGQEVYLAMLLRELQSKKVSVLLYSSLTGTSWASILEEFEFTVFTTGSELTIAIDCLISLVVMEQCSIAPH